MGRGVAVEPFELQRDRDQPVDDLFLLTRLLQTGLFDQGLRQRHRIGRVLRHQLAELVDLAVGHFENAADVAQHGARLQRSEGDDLADLLAPVFLLDVADHLLAPVLAEIDVEVGHRHAFGIEEALEQQREAQRIEVGDRQRIGNQRACARTTTGADGNALRLGPFDEVGNDQEVARELHPLDDRQLEFQPLTVAFGGLAGRQPVRGKPRLQPLDGLAPQFGDLGRLGLGSVGIGASKARQDRRTGPWPVAAALGDLDRVVQGFRQVGEQHRHLVLGLQAVVARQATPVLLADQTVAGDGDQGVMGFEIVGLQEEGLVRSHQRQRHVVGELQRVGLDLAAAPFVALQLDIEPVAEDRHHPLHAAAGEIGPVRRDRRADRTERAAGQGDDSLGPRLQPIEQHMRARIVGMPEIGERDDLHEIGIARFRRRDQHQRRDRGQATFAAPAPALLAIGELDVDLAAGDRLDAGLGRLLGKLQSAEQIVGVADADRRRVVALCELDDLVELQRAFEQGKGAVDPQMDEFGFGIRRHAAAPSFPSRPSTAAGSASRREAIGHVPSRHPND